MRQQLHRRVHTNTVTMECVSQGNIFEPFVAAGGIMLGFIALSAKMNEACGEDSPHRNIMSDHLSCASVCLPYLGSPMSGWWHHGCALLSPNCDQA